MFSSFKKYVNLHKTAPVAMLIVDMVIVSIIAYILGGVSIPLYSYEYDEPLCYKDGACEYYEDYCLRAFRIDRCDRTTNKIPYSSDTMTYQVSGVAPV